MDENIKVDSGENTVSSKAPVSSDDEALELVRVAVDAMGGDNAPDEIVRGALDAVKGDGRLKVWLVGCEESIRPVLEKYGEYPEDRVVVYPASEVIEMAEPPVNAIRNKKDSSIVKGMMLVKNGVCDAFVTAGSSGATLAGGQLLVGRIKGIERPAFAPLMPTAKGPVLLIDCGANVDPKPSQLVQFAQMGSIYMENVIGIRNPRVALLNIGTEEEKGNALTKETYPLLKACDNIHFTGNIEARSIPEGEADVIVCDAFAGNMVLKMYEGVASTLLHEIKTALMSDLRSKLGALLIKPALKTTLKKFDASAYGGAPVLGLTGLVVKAHGSAKAIELKHAVEQCAAFKEQKINELFKDRMKLVDHTKKHGNQEV